MQRGREGVQRAVAHRRGRPLALTPASATMEHDAIDAVRSGDAPLGLAAVRAWHDQGIRSFDALVAPLLVDRPELQAAVLHSDVAADMLAGLDGSGLTGIGILPGPMQPPGGRHPRSVGRLRLPGRRHSRSRPERSWRDRSRHSAQLPPHRSSAARQRRPVRRLRSQQLSGVGENEYDGVARSVTVNVTSAPAASRPVRQQRSDGRAQRAEPGVPAGGGAGDDRHQDRHTITPTNAEDVDDPLSPRPHRLRPGQPGPGRRPPSAVRTGLPVAARGRGDVGLRRSDPEACPIPHRSTRRSTARPTARAATSGHRGPARRRPRSTAPTP